MKLAVVTDTPKLSRPAARYIDATLEACAAAAGLADLEAVVVAAVPDEQPGGKAPAIGVIRAERDAFLERLQMEAPDAILSLGSAALNALAGGKKAAVLKREHGRMRLQAETGLPWVPTIDAWRVVKWTDLHRDFAACAYKIMTQRAPLPAMSIETYVIQDADDLSASVALLEGATVVGLDVETTGLAGWADEVTALGLGAVYDDTSGVAVVVPYQSLRDPDILDVLWEEAWRRDRRSVGHNLKFDQQFIARLFETWTPEEALIGDTLLLAHLLDERPNQPKTRARGSGLKDLVAQRYDHDYGFDFTKSYEQLTAEEVHELHLYLGKDVVYTARLWHDLVRDAEEEGGRVLETHDRLLVPVSRAVARAEVNGAPVDAAWVSSRIAALGERAQRRRSALEAAIRRLAPMTEVTNILAPQQIADVMYDEWSMTPDVRQHGKLVEGDRSTDQDHIKAAVAKYRTTKYRDTHYWAAAGWLQSLVRLRKDVRLQSVYQKQLLDMRDAADRVHPNFLLHGAATGRISVTQPAIQTIPAVDDREQRNGRWWYKLRDGSWVTEPMRKAFAAKPGRLWVEVDYSQLELRVAAGLTGDEAFIEVFRSGRDVHSEVAAAIFSKAPEDISKPERYLAKAVSFGILYGRSAKAIAGGEEMDFAERELGMKRWTEDIAQAFINKFLRSYPKLQDWITRMHQEVPAAGYVETPHGRRRRFPLVTERELAAIQRQAVNTPIQGAASDICLTAFVDLTREIETRGLDAVVLFPVHDSICIEVAEDQVGPLRLLCLDIMERPFMGCPLKVDFEFGPTWADVGAHEDNWRDPRPSSLRRSRLH